ncbi:unnamed protein product [Boreogadus saida]
MRRVPFSIVGEHLAGVLGAQAGGAWQYKSPCPTAGKAPRRLARGLLFRGRGPGPYRWSAPVGPPRYHHVSLDGFS